MILRKMIHNNWFVGILISLISAIILWVFNILNNKISIHIWILFLLFIGGFFICEVFIEVIKYRRINKIIKCFHYAQFLDYQPCKWEYIKDKNGAFGYIPINIRPFCPDDNGPLINGECAICHKHYCSKDIDEDKIKNIILLSIYKYMLKE